MQKCLKYWHGLQGRPSLNWISRKRHGITKRSVYRSHHSSSSDWSIKYERWHYLPHTPVGAERIHFHVSVRHTHCTNEVYATNVLQTKPNTTSTYCKHVSYCCQLRGGLIVHTMGQHIIYTVGFNIIIESVGGPNAGNQEVLSGHSG